MEEVLLNEGFAQGFNYALTIAVAISVLFTVFLLTLPSQYNPFHDSPPLPAGSATTRARNDNGIKKNWRKGGTTHVVVLGDIGRSPRMQYHAISIAKNGGRVYLIGYVESEIHPQILSDSRITVVPIAPAPAFLRQSSRALFPVIAPLKALWQAGSLYWALCYRAVHPGRWMLVQNPPSIPTLAVASLVCLFRNTRLVCDWHNFGYTILALKLGPKHPLVWISAFYERFFSRLAISHLTVTHAMKDVLEKQFGIKGALTLHDRPVSSFHPISEQERAAFLQRLPETAPFAENLLPSAKEMWKLITSSTSWTPDEDFQILLDALTAYSAQAGSNPKLPKLLVLITGKGPLKEHYLTKIRKNPLSHVLIRTAWLTPEDYALLLASADMGVSLHTSSSGVDLPMKVVDLFGAGTPVLAHKFQALGELVKEGENGLGFSHSEELSDLIVKVFQDDVLLEKLKDGALRESKHRWDDEWDSVAGKLLKLV
ncbi:beta-1,4-mannosyltransferas-like protein [Westerdykella ornata]|uniref:Chitobiosyldiphosphodolichol beta-mannosyltransferase n=1 Tax=Westerdykella ornata TaxID=318751 RepID=A0A6A6JD66_WESOR|nr:beta-1,4-mannosyltransferas-like protein [Westerdykella ornata]KAF2273938.1 beta-1,4-mannosyltransferas-like protein [Westerdykella ornata]